MTPQLGDWIIRRRQTRALRHWRDAAETAGQTDPAELRDKRIHARAMQRVLTRFLQISEKSLPLPRSDPRLLHHAPGTDWTWRPDLWTGPNPQAAMASVRSQSQIAEGVTLFHDCQHAEIALRTQRNTRVSDLAPFGLSIEVFHFAGSFLSIAVDLPPEAAVGLRKRHLIALALNLETERPQPITARLNIRHGPNVEQLVRDLPLGDNAPVVEFDLAYTKMNEKRVEGLWLDLIFGDPQMNRLVLHDLTLSRRPRADL